MRRYADPTRCPDCGSPLSPDSLTCPGCLLDLSGPLAQELFATLTRADSLLLRMREPVLVAAGAGTPAAPVATLPPGTEHPVLPAPAAAHPRSRVDSASVPRILLALGAVCLLVAALVFLVVTWSQMGIAGRTATLLGFTLVTGSLTAWTASRGLRGAVEALGLVTLGLVVLDVYGARTAGWLGELSDAGMTAVVGVVLVGTGLGAVGALARTEAAGFAVGELAAVAGAVLLSAGLAAQDWGATSVRQLLALCLVLALTAAVWRLVEDGSNVFRLAAWGLAPVALLDWAALVLIGLDHLGGAPTLASAWARLDTWPLLAAGAVALLVAVPRRLPVLVRVGSAALGAVPVALAVVAPAVDESTTVLVLAVAGVSLALAALMTFTRSPWGATGLAAAALCSLVLTVETLVLLGVALERYADAASASWSGTPGGRLPEDTLLAGGERWLLPLCVAVLIALLWSATRLVEAGRAVRWQAGAVATGVALAASLVVTLLLLPVPVWSVLGALLVLAIATGRPALTRDSVPAATLSGTVLLAAVVLSWYDEQLTAATVSVALVLMTGVHLRTRHEGVAAIAGGAVAALLAGLAWTVGAVADAEGSWTALVGLLLLAALVLGRHRLPVGTRTPAVDVVLEVTAGCAALALAATALDVTASADRSTWLAVYLTVAGAVVTTLSIVRRERRKLAWLGGVLLAAATWVRLEDIGVDEPEPYTLPSALALLVVGLLRLRRDPTAGTHATLGAGLVLALVPSLLWVGSYPGGLRSVLLGLACLGLVLAGAQLRWLAPLIYGAGVGLVVVLVEAGPHVGDAVPRWGLIGAAGALLITLGVTWEQRLRDARAVASYVRGLR